MMILEVLAHLAEWVLCLAIAWFLIPLFVFLIAKSAAYGYAMGVEAGRVEIQERLNRRAGTPIQN